MALPSCTRCGKQNPQLMHGLMCLWFAPLVDIEGDLGYFYLCPDCHDEFIVPELERIQNRILELHPAAQRHLDEIPDVDAPAEGPGGLEAPPPPAENDETAGRAEVPDEAQPTRKAEAAVEENETADEEEGSDEEKAANEETAANGERAANENETVSEEGARNKEASANKKARANSKEAADPDKTPDQ